MTPMLDDLATHLDAEEQRTGERLGVLAMPPTYLAMIAAEFGLTYESNCYFTLKLTGERYLTVLPATVH